MEKREVSLQAATVLKVTADPFPDVSTTNTRLCQRSHALSGVALLLPLRKPSEAGEDEEVRVSGCPGDSVEGRFDSRLAKACTRGCLYKT